MMIICVTPAACLRAPRLLWTTPSTTSQSLIRSKRIFLFLFLFVIICPHDPRQGARGCHPPWRRRCRWTSWCSQGRGSWRCKRCAGEARLCGHRVAEVARGHGGPLQKSLDSNETFKPYHMLFCRELGFVAIYALFGVLWARSALLHGIYCILYWVKFAFVAKIVNTRLTKIFMAIFPPYERLPSSATLVSP